MTNDTHLSAGTEAAGPSRPKQRITPRALLEVKRLGDPRLHPDGRSVAFVVTEADFEESRWVSHLWLTEWPAPEETNEAETARADAGEREQTAEKAPEEETDGAGEDDHDPTRQITFSHDGESHPRWSPDGRYLAFLSARPDPSEPLPDEEDEEDEPEEQVWVLPIDGGEARKVTSAREGVVDYVWTSDSAALVFLAPEPRAKPVDSVRKERERRKVDPTVEQEDKLRRQFWRVNVEERKPKLLFTADYGVQEFALSPDDQRICYATNYTGEWNDYHLVDLWIRDLSDGAHFKLVERAGGKYRPRWSPNGAQIAFLSWLDPQLSYSRESLFIVDVSPVVEAKDRVDATGDGTSPASLHPSSLLPPPSFDYDLLEFEWSRHDGSLYATAAVHTGSEIYRILPEMVRLDLGNAAERQDIHLDPEGGALVYVQETETALPEVFLRDDQDQVHQLTRLNADVATTYRLPCQEVVRWTSPDGMPIEGVLTYPLDYREGTRYPLILQIHGGPKGRAVNTLRGYTMPPVWAAEDYLVLQPNYRGSEGYGNAFAVANRRDLGGGDFADIMAGVDWCIAAGLADPDRLGVMGGSYGGYMTNWAIGHTDRFKAAVSMFGIFHLQTDYSNSDLSGWDNDYLGSYYWEDPEIYRRLSPGSYIENIKTPTLIIHGEDDNNTFISNSKELYQALRHRKVTTQFVHYPREGHGLREPNHKLDEIRRCLAWMDKYVRHGGKPPPFYRVGDKIPSADGLLELMVTGAEIASFIGQPEVKKEEQQTPEAQSPPASALLEVTFTIHNLDTRRPASPLTLALADLRLEERDASSNILLPVGVPLDMPGGKVLVEGENLRTTHHPNADTGELAFAFGAVFRVPRSGDCLLHVVGFPVVAVHWSADEEDEDKGG